MYSTAPPPLVNHPSRCLTAQETNAEAEARKELTLKLVKSLDKADALNRQLDQQHFAPTSSLASTASTAAQSAELLDSHNKLRQTHEKLKRDARRMKRERDRLQQQQLQQRSKNVQLQSACARAWKDMHSQRAK